MNVEKSLNETLNEAFYQYKKQYVALILATIIAFIGSIFIVTAPPLFFGVYYVALKIMRGEEAEYKDVFKGFDYLLTSWLMFIAATIAVCIGLIFVIIPGILLIALFQYAVPIAIKEKMGAIEALKKSAEVGWKNLTYTVIFFILMIVIEGIAGAIPLASLIAYPYTVLCACIAVEKLTKMGSEK